MWGGWVGSCSLLGQLAKLVDSAVESDDLSGLAEAVGEVYSSAEALSWSFLVVGASARCGVTGQGECPRRAVVEDGGIDWGAIKDAYTLLLAREVGGCRRPGAERDGPFADPVRVVLRRSLERLVHVSFPKLTLTDDTGLEVRAVAAGMT